MRFHAILVLRDEADIIRESLAHLRTWADAVHVMDTGSTDGTWELVKEAAEKDGAIHAVESRPLVFDSNVRGTLFERVRHTFEEGDWVARVDADEFYHAPPPRWAEAHLKRGESRVFAQLYEFSMTRRELLAWEAGSETRADRARPIIERRRAYIIEPVIEMRLFKYRKRMQWNAAMAQPFNVGLTARERIPVRHYRWRDPPQMMHRCKLRGFMVKQAYHGVHWAREDWMEWVADDADPRLAWWGHGEELPRVMDLGHLSPWGVRVAQELTHRTGLARVLDRLRQPMRWKPIWLEEEVQRRLAVEAAGVENRATVAG